MAFTELKLQVVLPLAGRSNRFKTAGVSIPKPIIPVLGRPMVHYALESILPLLPKSDLVGVACAEDQIKEPLQKIFEKYSAKSKILELPVRTAGPVQTVLGAKHALDPQAPLLLIDGDICFQAQSFVNALMSEAPLTALPGGHLLCFTSNDPAFSYVKTDTRDRLIEIAEKKVISNSALVGAYHFRTAGEFLQSAQSLVTQSPSREHYISHVVGDLLKFGAEFAVIPCDFHHSLGTPEHLHQSERFLMEMNP